jgi:small-conductance mechanosensitive channel
LSLTCIDDARRVNAMIVDWMKENWRDVAESAAVVTVAFVVERLVTRALHRLQTNGKLPPITARLMRRAVQWVMLLLVALTIVSIFGDGAARLWTYLGTVVAVVGVGFVAQWSSLSNVTAGFIILVWRPFRLGERVELLPDGPAGHVEDINTMFTTLRSEDGSRFAVPNNQFIHRVTKCSTAARESPPPEGA